MKVWRDDVGQGRTRRPRIDVFLTHWLTMKSEGEVSWQSLFDDFRKWTAATKPGVEGLVIDLTDNARIFDGFDAYPVGSHEQLFFYRLGVMESNTAFPVILWLFGPNGIADPEERRRALGVIESWLVRRMLRRLTPKAYNQVFLALLKHLAQDGNPSAAKISEFLALRTGDSQEWPRDDAVLESLRTLPYYTSIPRSRLRMVLEAVEADMRGALVGPFTAWGSLSIEHVLPQEWRSHWPLSPSVDELKAGIDRDAAKHRLGNLSLVTHPLNSSLSNAPWTAPTGQASKREALREFNVLMLNKSLVDLESWDESSIAERGERLAQRILRIWPGPSPIIVLAGPETVPAPPGFVPPTDKPAPTALPGSAAGGDVALATPEAFHLAMVDLYKRAKAEAGYNAGYFLGMVSDIGGLETARYLLHASDPSDGYVALWELGRLDLTVEAAILSPRWYPLFTDGERAIARERLEAYRFDVEGYLASL